MTAKSSLVILKKFLAENDLKEIDPKKYLKKNLMNDEIIIGMGAGVISKWMRGLKYSLWR